jgi:hypothetical protein
MDKLIQVNIKKLYYYNIRLSQIYGILSRKVKEPDTSLLFHQFSSDTYNNARTIKIFIESHDGNVSIILKLLHEMDSFWIGFFSFYLGPGIVKKYTAKKELKLKKLLTSVLLYIIEKDQFLEIINSIDDHIKKIEFL